MYRRSYYRGRSAKFSNETVAFNTQLTEGNDAGDPFPVTQLPDGSQYNGIPIVPSTPIMGTRKVKNFTIKVTARNNDDPIYGVLVYVPENTQANTPGTTGPYQSLYEPNQNVIATFIIPSCCTRDPQGDITSAGAPTQIVVSNRLARNLSSGDSISLLFSSPNGLSATEGEPMTISGTVNYSIKF